MSHKARDTQEMGGVSEQADDGDGIMMGPIREQGYDDVIMNEQSESRDKG